MRKGAFCAKRRLKNARLFAAAPSMRRFASMRCLSGTGAQTYLRLCGQISVARRAVIQAGRRAAQPHQPQQDGVDGRAHDFRCARIGHILRAAHHAHAKGACFRQAYRTAMVIIDDNGRIKPLCIRYCPIHWYLHAFTWLQNFRLVKGEVELGAIAGNLPAAAGRISLIGW